MVRRRLAEARGLPAYCILHDSTLREMARDYPATEHELARIGGMGERKREQFGATFIAEIATYLDSHPRQIFADDGVADPGRITGRATVPDQSST
jgi:ATP-dependent DNA helicase RecQ